jgi:hypothetical protein
VPTTTTLVSQPTTTPTVRPAVPATPTRRPIALTG